MRLAQYSLPHHSTNLRRVSRPTVPPSGSASLEVDLEDGAGEGTLDGTEEDAAVPFTSMCLFSLPSASNFVLAFISLPAALSVSRFPVPNLLQG